MGENQKENALTRSVEKFDRKVAALPGFAGTLLPIGDGIICAAKTD